MWSFWLAGTALIWPLLGWYAQHHRGSLGYRVSLLLMIALPALLPWTAPATSPSVRFILLLPGLLLMGKTWELAVNRPSDPERFANRPQFWVWALFTPEGEWCTNPQSKREARTHGFALGVRGLAKGVGLILLLALNEATVLHDVWLVSIVWMAFLMYCALGGVVDAVGALGSLFGIRQTTFLNSPVLAQNPRDFWGRRWNLWFTNTAHRLIFQPLGGTNRPMLAGLAVFAFSAVMHEYMVFVSLQQFDGRMLGFFGVHGVATMLYTLYARGPGRSVFIPQPLAVALHIMWFAATGPLFFGPVDDIFDLTSWELSSNLVRFGLTAI